MNKEKIIKQLESEGYTDVRVCPMPRNEDLESHTHDEHTVHIILKGELTITDETGEKVYKPGDRVDFPEGTTHKARSNVDDGEMIVGVKYNQQAQSKKHQETTSQLPRQIGAPATRTLAAKGITSIEELANFTEKEILDLHGMGPKAFGILKEELKNKKLKFKS